MSPPPYSSPGPGSEATIAGPAPAASPGGAPRADGRSEASGPPEQNEVAPRWRQLLTVGTMLGVCVAHFSLVSWLFALPRYHREPFAFRLCCDPWAWYVNRWFLKAPIRVLGEENLPASWHGYLYASNHESLVDIVLLTAKVRRGFLMKRSVLLSPIGLGTYLSGSVSLDRSSKHDRARALREALRMAREAMSIIVFPEGSFGHPDGRLRRPHLNLLRHAWHERLGVVPLGHAGCRRAVDGQSLPIRTGQPLVLVVRPVVRPEGYGDADTFAAACWTEVVAAVRQARGEIEPGWPYERDPGDELEPPSNEEAGPVATGD